MEPELYDGTFLIIEGEFNETFILPEPDYEPDMGEIKERQHGYGYRMTMSGYLDCTGWYVFDTEVERDAAIEEEEEEANEIEED